MTPTKDIQLETVGQVVDYLRTKEGLEVITDEELNTCVPDKSKNNKPVPKKKTDSFIFCNNFS